MSERQYVPHGITGEPVPVLTPEEQATQQANQKSHPAVGVGGWRCHCGAKKSFRAKMIWLLIGDALEVTCKRGKRGHTSLIRFLPETITRRS